MTDIHANASHLRDKIIFVDPGSGSGPYSFTIFPHTLADLTKRDNARITIVAKSASLVTIDIVADGTTRILNPISFAPVVTLTAFLAGEAIELIYSGSRDEWLVKQKVAVPYVEIWAATPIVGINGTTINWTFQDIGLGASSILFSHAAGVLTYLPTLTQSLNVNLEEISQLNFAANNSDVDWSYSGLFVGAGFGLFGKILDFAAHPRTATFNRSAGVGGVLVMATGDTFRVNCASTGSNGSTVDLDSGSLIFSTTL